MEYSILRHIILDFQYRNSSDNQRLRAIGGNNY